MTKRPIVFVVTTPFAVNAFLRTHLLELSKTQKVILCVNCAAYPLLEEISKNIHVIDVEIVRKISLSRDLVALFSLLSIFIKLRPACVHTMTPKAGLLGMLAAYLAAVPNRTHTFTGQIWINQSGVKKFFLKTIDRLIASLARVVMADSQSQIKLLQDERVVRPSKVTMLGSGSVAGVDLTRFHPNPGVRDRLRAKYRVSPDTCVFLFVGRLVKDKGVFDLLLAYKSLCKSYNHTELWFVGPDEDDLVQELKELAGQLCKNLRWFGATDTPEIFMVAADILVLPSYREGFGSVIIEASACGVPAIAYRINGVVDAIEHDRTGLLVEVGEIELLKRAMLMLAENESRRNALATEAMVRAQKLFSSSTITAEMVTFYQRTLS